MKKLLGIRISILAAVLLCFVCLPVRANLITIVISGQVTSVSDPCSHFQNKIHIGDTITGTYTYNSATLDSQPDPAVGYYGYTSPPVGICLTVGSFEFRTDPCSVDFALRVANNYIGADSYNVSSYSNLPLSDGTPVQFIFWWLDDSTGTALSSDALPLAAPDLNKWDNNILYITHDRDFGVSATVTSAVLVPEPATLLLLVFSIAICKRR